MNPEPVALAIGSRLGPYEILAPLGAGGMGEVYRARDTRLGRDVAIKVLPAHLVGDADLRARFEREARSVAALNHPHICALYDVGREGDREYLVMELLEGETLAARLARGAFPTAEVLRLGTQIADALDRAHRQGLVHRDLKPGNIMLTRQGAKLLDFGLARHLAPAAPPGSSAVRPPTPSSPTMTAPLTSAGSIVGTFQYMAPELLEGGEADARSDLWALGIVLYQMTTGLAAFEGASQARLIAAILTSEPKPITELVPLAPPGLDRLVRALLAKDPGERIQTAHDVKLHLQWIAEGGSQAGVPLPVAARRRLRERVAWLAAGIGLLATGLLGGTLLAGRRSDPPLVRFVVQPPPGATAMSWPRISPDGSMLAFVAADSAGRSSIWVRPLASTTAQRLAGTEDTGRPFWSPDSKELGFFDDEKLYRVAASGGPVRLVGEAPGSSDGSWGAAGFVLYDGGVGDSLHAVQASGGGLAAASRLDRSTGESQHAWPSFLPDGKRYLFQVLRTPSGSRATRLGRIGTLESELVDSLASRVEFLPSGHLVYVSDGALMAKRFDPGRGRVSGSGVVLGEAAFTTSNTEAFSVSNNGVIAYQAASPTPSQLVVGEYDRSGRRLRTVAGPDFIRGFAVSPDGSRIALSIRDARTHRSDLWIRDLARGTLMRFTSRDDDETTPIWSPDGRTLAYAAYQTGVGRIYTKPLFGSAEERLLPGQAGDEVVPCQWSPDGRFFTAMRIGGFADWDAVAFGAVDTTATIVLSSSRYSETGPQLSPDGRFVAWASNEGGRSDVYVQAFPHAGARWQASTSGGSQPLWIRGGRELVFRDGVNGVLAVDIASAADGSVAIGAPRVLFRSATVPGLANARWNAREDGQRFYLLEPFGSGPPHVTPIVVILNAASALASR